ncbi:hypothetical protein L1887_37488 [Cichorium endivia]|nr:hypothetical protein L1887_37488 [Cichorium endivia]
MVFPLNFSFGGTLTTSFVNSIFLYSETSVWLFIVASGCLPRLVVVQYIPYDRFQYTSQTPRSLDKHRVLSCEWISCLASSLRHITGPYLSQFSTTETLNFS